MFPSAWVLEQLNLKLCRDVDSEDHEGFQCFFIGADFYWATNLVYGAYKASGEEYRVSYGQVWQAFLCL